MYILSADLGGTKTLLQLSLCQGNNIVERHSERFVSADFNSLVEMVAPFIKDKQILSACFAVAGPVHNHGTYQTAEITNLPWNIDSRDISEMLGIPRATFINDFQAIGYGIHLVENHHSIHIQHAKRDANGVRAIIGAGTGLGQAFMVDNSSGYQIFPTEGGHVDFAPANEEEISLLEFLLQRYEHVSYERVLSGAGLVNIYQYLQHRYPERVNEAISELMKQKDPAAVISTSGLAEPDSLCGKALSIFVRIYAAQAGNMALNFLCSGGLYIAGGIAAKIEGVMNSEQFRQAFNDKGRMSHITRATPVTLITDPQIGLHGAEYLALQM